LSKTSKQSGSEDKGRELPDVKVGIDVMDVLTEEDKKVCRHALGNCAESVPFEAMRGNLQPHTEPVFLYTRTLALPTENHRVLIAKDPSRKCKYVIDNMDLHRVAIIYPY
jgi:hypothetical protein